MKSNRTSRLSVVAALIFGLALSPAPVVHAGDRIAEIEDVDSVDPGNRTILLAGTTYRLPPDVRIFGPHGRRVSLRSLKATDNKGPNAAVHEVEFVSERVGSGWVLRSLKVLGYASHD